MPPSTKKRAVQCISSPLAPAAAIAKWDDQRTQTHSRMSNLCPPASISSLNHLSFVIPPAMCTFCPVHPLPSLPPSPLPPFLLDAQTLVLQHLVGQFLLRAHKGGLGRQKEHAMTLLSLPHRHAWTVPIRQLDLRRLVLVVPAWAQRGPQLVLVFGQTWGGRGFFQFLNSNLKRQGQSRTAWEAWRRAAANEPPF